MISYQNAHIRRIFLSIFITYNTYTSLQSLAHAEVHTLSEFTVCQALIARAYLDGQILSVFAHPAKP